MSKVRLYKITRGSHTRREFEDGTPVINRKEGRARGSQVVVYKSDGRNEILLTEDQAASPAFAHLKPVLVIGGVKVKSEAPAPSSGSIVIPEDWNDLPVGEKRKLASQIKGGEPKDYKVADAEAVIQEYLDGSNAPDA